MSLPLDLDVFRSPLDSALMLYITLIFVHYLPQRISYLGRCMFLRLLWSCRTLWWRLPCSPGLDQSSIHLRDKHSRDTELHSWNQSQRQPAGAWRHSWTFECEKYKLYVKMGIMNVLKMGSAAQLPSVGGLQNRCKSPDSFAFFFYRDTVLSI